METKYVVLLVIIITVFIASLPLFNLEQFCLCCCSLLLLAFVVFIATPEITETGVVERTYIASDLGALRNYAVVKIGDKTLSVEVTPKIYGILQEGQEVVVYGNISKKLRLAEEE